MERKHQLPWYRTTAPWSIATIWLALIIISGSSAVAQNPAYHNVTSDFEAGWNAGNNPNGVWSYGWSHGIRGNLTLFTRNHIPAVNNHQQQMWDDPDNSYGFTPSVARNASIDFNDGNLTMKAGALLLHAGGNDGVDYAHVIWTAPADGEYSLSATFFAQQNGINVDVNILVNGESVYDETITSNGVSRTFSKDFTLSSGAMIDFAVGPNDDFNLHPGNTGLDVTIQKTSLSTGSESDARSSRHEGMTMHARPNPFTDEFTLGYDLAPSPLRVQIIDMMGQVVETREIPYPDKEIILGSELPTGAYLVEIIQAGERRRMLVHKTK